MAISCKLLLHTKKSLLRGMSSHELKTASDPIDKMGRFGQSTNLKEMRTINLEYFDMIKILN